MALQTHINDIMMKRLTKAKAAMVPAGEAGAAVAQGAAAGAHKIVSTAGKIDNLSSGM